MGRPSPHVDPISFIFIRFFARILTSNKFPTNSGVDAPLPVWEFLDPQLNQLFILLASMWNSVTSDLIKVLSLGVTAAAFPFLPQ